MEDNLPFYNFKECNTFEERKFENCSKKVLEYCENDLNIEGAASSIKINRGHRIGKFESDSGKLHSHSR
jgi:hypothetical protein